MALLYTIPAIPTIYNGRQYRSRLEAKWAAFFDRVGWKSEYEPFDLGEWSPDFLVTGGTVDLLVEVKPVTEIDVRTIYKMHTAANDAGFGGDLLLLGVSPFKGTLNEPYIGWLCSNESPESIPNGRERRGYPAEMQMMPWFTRAEAVLIDGRTDLIMPYPYAATRGGVRYCTGLLSGTFVSEDRCWGGSRQSYHGIWTDWAAATNAVQWLPR